MATADGQPQGTGSPGEGSKSLAGQTALVTGASRGIGRAIAAALSARGCWVGMVARSEDELRAAAAETGGHAIPGDVTSAAVANNLVAYLADVLGGAPDLVVNAAGAYALAPVAETDPVVFDRLIAANLCAPFLVMRAFLPGMLARGSGHLISIGSVAGRSALPGNGAYAAAKYGLRGLHEVLASEIRGTGVRATLIDPAATDTPLWDDLDPDSRDDLPSRSEMLQPEDVARAVLYAATQPPEVEVVSLLVRSAR